MNTMQAEYRTDIARLAESISERDARKAESDANARWWQMAIILAGFGIVIASIGIFTALF